MEQTWFEMLTYRKRSMDAATWIPLYAVESIQSAVEFGYVGYREDFFGCGSVAVPVAQRALVEKLEWNDIGIENHHQGSFDNGNYRPAEAFKSWADAELNGINLIMVQENSGKLEGDWLLHPDLVLTLGLHREGDVWVCPDEGYVEVIRLTHNKEGEKTKIEIKAEFLKDYLCARKLGIWLTWYRERDEIQEGVAHLTWPGLNSTFKSPHLSWEGRVIEIHEGGEPFGSSAAIMHVTRTDVDFEEDVPLISLPTSDEGTATTTTTRTFKGRKLYRVLGELWREEWITPGAISPRVRRDETPSKATFVVDAAGTREDQTTLRGGGRWLWFKPDVVNALLKHRDGTLKWHTGSTGSVGADSAGSVSFGVNELGLVNVYAKDISYLRDWQQQIWAGYNIGPDGGVSKELLKSQAEGRPSHTLAPEAYLETALRRLNEAIMTAFGVVAIKHHDDTQKILAKCHRFRATTFDGLLELAKDLARLSADSIDKTQLQTVLTLANKEKLGSLKSLEKLLVLRVGDEQARVLTGPLFGVYDLRLADAHLASSQLTVALKLAGVDLDSPGVVQGQMMLHRFVSALVSMTDVVEVKLAPPTS